MKKLTFIVLCATIIACNKSTTTNSDATSNGVLWASNVETLLPMVQDTLWSKENWDEVYKYNKKTIFESMTKAVLAGKLKAFTAYPAGELSINDFKNRIEKWDSTHMAEDPNNPGTMLSAPLLMKVIADDIVQMRFNESMELDTVNYTLNKKVSFVTFNTYKLTEDGQIMGMYKLFDVKLNDLSTTKKE